MNVVETSLRRAADNKEILRVNLSCKWTPISLQGDHLIPTIFWIPDGNTLHVRIQAIENLLAVILIPKTIQTEEFTNIFVILKISRKLDKGKKPKLGQSSDFFGHQPWGIARGVTDQSHTRSG